jgi:hypothetical protein
LTHRLFLEQLEDRLTPSAIGTPNQNFVAQVFLDVLGRQVDSAGLALWSSKLDQGASPSDVVRGIEGSTEFRTLEVEAQYHQFLERDADPTSLSNALAFLEGGGSSRQLATSILASPEFFQHNGNDNDRFLSDVYEHVLGRAVDADGRAGWDQVFAANVPRDVIAGLILHGVESSQREVVQRYQTFLHRLADPNGLATMTALERSAGDEAVIAAITGSSEYFQLAQLSTPTTTTLLSSGNPSGQGQPVTFMALVSPPTGVTFIPTGTVTFLVDGTVAQQTPLSNGSASFTTATLTTGAHTITALYTGDARFASSSQELIQTVAVNVTQTTTTLMSSSNPVAINVPVTFTATVSPTAAPGTIDFLVDGILMQMSAVVNGMATYTTQFAIPASHQVVANFISSSPNFSNSSSNVVKQQVTFVDTDNDGDATFGQDQGGDAEGI